MNKQACGKLVMTACATWLGAAALGACSQDSASSPTEEPSASTHEALGTVIACQQQEDACAADAGTLQELAQCEFKLHECLKNLFLEAGLPTLPDTGVPLPPWFDAGPPLPIPDGGVPSVPACVAELQLCLESTTSPSTCASEAHTCLEKAANAECNAQESLCLASGAPVVLCQAARQACL
jgi:hypothetical protein